MTLVRDDIPFTTMPTPYNPTHPDTKTYCAATTIHPPKDKQITVINIYVPPARWSAGQGTQHQAFQPTGLAIGPRTLIGGDFNAHSKTWDSFQREDDLGKELEEWANDKGLVILNDSSPTRINPSSGGKSAPDITFTSGDLAQSTEWTTQPNMGSDHLPITTTLDTNPISQPQKRGAFNYKKADWAGFRKTLNEDMAKWTTPENLTAKDLDARFTESVMKAAKQNIPYGCGNRKGTPFWNERCQEAVDKRNEAQRKATSPNHTREDVEQYKTLRKEADDTIFEEKREHFKTKLSEMGPDADLWGLIKSMDGRRPSAKPAATIIRPNTQGPAGQTKPATTDKEKANMFAKQYQSVAKLPKKQETRPQHQT